MSFFQNTCFAFPPLFASCAAIPNLNLAFNLRRIGLMHFNPWTKVQTHAERSGLSATAQTTETTHFGPRIVSLFPIYIYSETHQTCFLRNQNRWLLWRIVFRIDPRQIIPVAGVVELPDARRSSSVDNQIGCLLSERRNDVRMNIGNVVGF